MAMVFGGLLALIHGFFCIHLRADQIVSGFAVNLLALGVTGFLFTRDLPLGHPARGLAGAGRRARLPRRRSPWSGTSSTAFSEA